MSSSYFGFFAIIISPLGKCRGPSFEQTWIPFTRNDLCQVWLKLATADAKVLEKKILKCFQFTFAILQLASPFKRVYSFIWTNLNHLYPSRICANCCWNWSSGSEEMDENVKSLKTDRWTDGRTTEDSRLEYNVVSWAFRSCELRF